MLRRSPRSRRACGVCWPRRPRSSASGERFIARPPAPMTPWHGATMGSGLALLAAPTARLDARAPDPVGEFAVADRLARWDLGGRLPDRVPERRTPRRQREVEMGQAPIEIGTALSPCLREGCIVPKPVQPRRHRPSPIGKPMHVRPFVRAGEDGGVDGCRSKPVVQSWHRGPGTVGSPGGSAVSWGDRLGCDWDAWESLIRHARRLRRRRGLDLEHRLATKTGRNQPKVRDCTVYCLMLMAD